MKICWKLGLDINFTPYIPSTILYIKSKLNNQLLFFQSSVMSSTYYGLSSVLVFSSKVSPLYTLHRAQISCPRNIFQILLPTILSFSFLVHFKLQQTVTILPFNLIY